MKRHVRGGKYFHLLYTRWLQILTFADLLGRDSRPSASKMMAFGISTSVLFTAIYKTTKGGFDNIWTWEMFWILFLCCAMMFGRWGFDRFIQVMKERN